MKKQSFLFLLVIASNLFLFSACNKDDNNTPKTKTELVSQGSWKFKSATVGGTPYSSLPACQTNNILTFNSNGTGLVDEGATKCNAADPQTNPFTWTFQNSETQILLSAPLFTNGSNTVTVVTLTETQLVLSMAISTPGPILTVVATFEH